jgi:hypothetical protein
MRREDVSRSLRFAGLVKRYHAWPVHRQQVVAEHTWHLMRIYVQLFGGPRGVVWEYMLHHDSPEIGTGDIPFHVKLRFPAIKTAVDDAEKEVVDGLGISEMTDTFGLKPAERTKIKICDLVEMFEYGWEEYHMGNKYSWPVIVGVDKEVQRILRTPEISAAERTIVLTYMAKFWEEPIKEDRFRG